MKTNAMATARKRFSIVHPGAVGHLVEKARKTHVDALGRHKRDDSEKKQRKPHAKLKKVSRARNAG